MLLLLSALGNIDRTVLNTGRKCSTFFRIIRVVGDLLHIGEEYDDEWRFIQDDTGKQVKNRSWFVFDQYPESWI